MCLLTILINLSGFWKYWFDFTMSLYIIGKNLEKTLQEIKHLIKKKNYYLVTKPKIRKILLTGNHE